MKSKPMKYITTLVSDCAMWNKLDLGTIIKVTDTEASRAIENRWAKKTSSNFRLRGEGKWVLFGIDYEQSKERENNVSQRML